MEDNRRIYKFNGTSGEDFQLWAARTEAALEAKEVLSVVTTDVIGDGTVDLSAEERLAVAKASATIIQGLGEKPLRLCISEKGNPYRMWQRLTERYAVANIVTKVQLQTKLARMLYAGQPMSEFIDAFEEIFNRLAGMGSAIAEDMQVAMLLASFGDKETSPFGHVIAALQSFETETSWEAASARLLQEYEEKVWLATLPKFSKDKKDSTRALTVAASKGRTDNRRRYGRKVERRKCYGCGKRGHIVKDCPDEDQDVESGNNAKTTANHATLLMAKTLDQGERMLIVDSGASDHMVMHRDWLCNVEKIQPRSVVLGNGASVIANYKGDMTIEAKLICSVDTIEREVTLKNVLFVPDLKANLISCSSLCRAGYDIKIGKKGCSVLLDGFLEFHARTLNGLYVVTGTVQRKDCGIALTARTKAETLWHNRLGHANIQSIKKMAMKDMVIGLDLDTPKSAKKDGCSNCARGKMSKLTLKSKEIRAKHPGEVIHSDVSGRMPVPSLGGSEYYVTFIDEYSGYKVVVPIATKDEVATKFKSFHVWFERKFDCKIKRLHCDGGGEYVGCDRYLQEHGIERQSCPPYTQELNGIAERANRTLMDCARAMLYHAKMPLNFWAEAVVHVADIRNRFFCPSSRNKTSYEMLTGKKPRVDHLRVFGSRCWAHVPKKLRKKLDPLLLEGVVIMCYEYSVYKVWLKDGRIALTRHIQIDENSFQQRDWYAAIPNSIFPDDEGFSEGTQQSEVKDVLSDRPQVITRNPSDNQPAPSVDQQGTNALTPQDLDKVTHIPAQPSTYGEGEAKNSNMEEVAEETLESEMHEDTVEEPIIDESEPIHSTGTVQTRYPQRTRSSPQYYRPGNANVAATPGDPQTVQEAMEAADHRFWKQAIKEEMQALQQHETWTVVDLPPGAKPISTRFVFKKKLRDDGTVGRYKARLVVRGFMQGDVDYTYSPVVDFTAIRTCLAVTVQRGYCIHQMDVRTAFLHGIIDEEVYVTLPEGSGIEIKEDQALKLNKGMYGLRQAARLWFEKWQEIMKEIGAHALKADPCVFRTKDVWILLYVDDIILMAKSRGSIDIVKNVLSEKLDIKDLGELGSFLGLCFARDGEGAWLSQKKYTLDILNRFGMSNCKTVVTPAVQEGTDSRNDVKLKDIQRYQEIVGSLLYLSTRTRPDISAAVNILCRSCASPSVADMTAAKRVLRYLQGTINYALKLSTDKTDMRAFADADWAGDRKDRKSTSENLVQFAGSSIYWKSGKQDCVALSSTEAEYISTSEICKIIA